MDKIKDIYRVAEGSVFNSLSSQIFDWLDGTGRSVVDGLLADKFGSRELFETELADIQIQTYYCLKANQYRYNTLYDTTVAMYNPMENYDMTEMVTTNTTLNKGSQIDSNVTGEQISSGNNADNMYAFDSVQPVGNSSSSANSTSGARTDTLTSGQRQDSSTETQTHTRHGNIGVMSGQDLILKSRETAEFSIYNLMAKDIAHAISIAIYM